MRNSKSQKSQLIRPDDDFWPLKRYKSKYGDPRDPANRKKGHVVSYQDGMKGVIVPGDDGDGPFKLRRLTETALGIHKEEDLGSNSSEEEEIGDRKFEEMAQQSQSAYASCAVGMLIGDLMKEVEVEAGQENKKAKKRPKKKKDPAQSKTRDKRAFAIAAMSDSDSDENCGGWSSQGSKVSVPCHAAPKWASPGGERREPDSGPSCVLELGPLNFRSGSPGSPLRTIDVFE